VITTENRPTTPPTVNPYRLILESSAVRTRTKKRSPLTRPAREREAIARTCSAVLAVSLMLKPRPSSTRTMRPSPKITTRLGRTRMSHSNTVKGANGILANEPSARMPRIAAVSRAPTASPVAARTTPRRTMVSEFPGADGSMPRTPVSAFFDE
jgi:hypothetical protein